MSRLAGARARTAAAPRDLVDLVDEDDAVLRGVDVLVRRVEQPPDRNFDVFAVVARLGERGGVVVRERDVEDLRQRAREIRLPAAARPDHEDVGFADRDVAAELQVLDALEMVVRRDRENFLRVTLPDDVLIELFEDAAGCDVEEAIDLTLFLHAAPGRRV